MKNLSTHDNTVLVKKVLHRKQVTLLLLFDYNQQLITLVKSLQKFTFSRTQKGWVCPYSEAVLLEVQRRMADACVLLLHDSLDKNPLQRGVKNERN